MTQEEKAIEIPFGAEDSELIKWEYTIPEGMEAEIKDGKVIIKKAESEDERQRRTLIEWLKDLLVDYRADGDSSSLEMADKTEGWIAYIEKQKDNTEGDFGRGYDCGYQAGYAVAMNEMKPKITTATLDSEKQKEQKPADLPAGFYVTLNGEKYYAKEVRCNGMNVKVVEPKPAECSEEQDYSGLSDLERAIHRGFLCAGVENVPRGIIEDTANEALVYARGLIKDELGKKHLEGYIMGREDTMREMSDFIKSHFNGEEAKGPNPPVINIPTWAPSCYNGGPCTNPQMDCINCPRKTTGGGFSTSSGTSTATLHGNTSATDGKEHNPSFTD